LTHPLAYTTDVVFRAVVLGAGATVLMDLWALFLRRAFGVASLDLGLLGRWIGHFADGQFRHERIAIAAPVRGERLIGWTAHYTIGVSFAVVLLAIAGPEWFERPTLMPALMVSTATLVAPLFVMQPAMGAGIAASRTPHPNAARLRSVVTHTVYGIGLYVAARLWTIISPTA
jgi:hypothetical protein